MEKTCSISTHKLLIWRCLSNKCLLFSDVSVFLFNEILWHVSTALHIKIYSCHFNIMILNIDMNWQNISHVHRWSMSKNYLTCYLLHIHHNCIYVYLIPSTMLMMNNHCDDVFVSHDDFCSHLLHRFAHLSCRLQEI